jgi:hypothetical protein
MRGRASDRSWPRSSEGVSGRRATPLFFSSFLFLFFIYFF